MFVTILGCAFAAPDATAQTVASAEPAGETTSGEGSAAVVTYPVAARDLERGEVLRREDIKHVVLDEGERVPEEVPPNLVGWNTRRVVAEGEPLRPPAVAPPDLVRAGEPVEAVYQGRSVVLRVSGTAAGSGAMGEWVLVRIDTHRRLKGVVIGPALVQLESNESR